MHYNGTNSYFFVNGTGSKEVVTYPLCLGNISIEWSVDHTKKTGLKGYVNDFSTDYHAIAVSDVLDIRKYVMKKNDVV